MSETARRWTKERQQLFDFIDRNHLVSAPMLEAKFPNIGRASIFRTLKTFTDLGILRRVNLGRGYDEYEAIESDANHHHEHMRCVKCNAVISFPSASICAQIVKLAGEHWFEVSEHSINVLGVCKGCQS